METRRKKILFMVQYPENVSPGQRFRVELYRDLLEKHGFTSTTSSFLDYYGYRIIHKEGLFFQKMWAVFKGYVSRLLLLFSVKKYDYIFLQREASPLGPPIFEWIIIKVLGCRVIYDFDDAIWMPHISDSNSLFLRLKSVSKVKKICEWAYKVSCGNEYLCNYARQFNKRIVKNPTCVDTEYKHNIIANQDVERVTIGWTGSFSTLKYLCLLEPVLQRLQEKFDFDVKVICNQAPELNLRNIKYVEWSAKDEVAELASCQIGLMPLSDDEWSKGKCGFKLIQYLSLEIAAVSSAVGVNTEIIEDGINGFICRTDEEWYNAIALLIEDASLRKRLGKEGREKIIRNYSLQSNTDNFLQLFS